MKLKKLFLIVSVCALITVIFTGCVKYNMGIVINTDNSADFKIDFLINSSLSPLPKSAYGANVYLDEAKKNAEKEGFKVTSKTEGDMKGYVFTKHFNNLNDLSKSIFNNGQMKSTFKNGKTNNEIFTVKKGFLQDTYTLNIDMNLGNIGGNSGTSGSSSDPYGSSSFLEGYQEKIASLMDFRFKVTVPYTVVSQNATTVSNNGKTLEWKLKYGGENKISAVFNMYTNMALIVLIAGIVIVLVILIVLLMMLRRKMKRSRALRNQIDYAGNPEAADRQENNEANQVVEPEMKTEIEPEVKPDDENGSLKHD